MSDSTATFGSVAVQLTSAAALVDLEVRDGRDARFHALDEVLAELVTRCASGEHVVQLVRGERQDRVELLGVSDERSAVIADAFLLESQQARGAWFLPETVPAKVGLVNFVNHFCEHPRYAHTVAAEERSKVVLAGSPAAMVLWSVLEPLFGVLFQPMVLRADKAGVLSKEEFATVWTASEDALDDTGLDLKSSCAVFSWGGGWARLSAEQQIAAKATLIASIAEHLSIAVLRRYRARAVRQLITQYYAKAKKGRAKRRQVVTKEHWRTLSAFFKGDWLAFVDYLGEQPHEEERVVTALPETKLMVSGKKRAVAIAEAKGIPLEELERILGAYWADASGESPVSQRVAVLASYWQEFDAIHSRQMPGMAPLWGLVQEYRWPDLETRPPHQPQLFRRILSPSLVSDIERVWRTTVLPKWPDRLVTEPFPHAAMAEAFGPALELWQGCALTAWFICEGPMSRTDIPGLANYYRVQLADLEEMGCAVHPDLFRDLKAVRLGPEQPLYDNDSGRAIDLGYGVSIEMRTSSGSRRDGFVALRDVITHHRRWWTENFLERYLRARWELSLRSAGRQFNLMMLEKGKPPTFKQFAKHAILPAQSWFGGDIGLVYAALGQKLTTSIGSRFVMPRDSARFAARVFDALGGQPFERERLVSSDEEGREQAEAEEQHRKLIRLAGESLSYVQLLEALGRPPTIKEFGPRFEWNGTALAPEIDRAWSVYEHAVNAVLEASAATQS